MGKNLIDNFEAKEANEVIEGVDEFSSIYSESQRAETPGLIDISFNISPIENNRSNIDRACE